jgi:hypothetical protein
MKKRRVKPAKRRIRSARAGRRRAFRRRSFLYVLVPAVLAVLALRRLGTRSVKAFFMAQAAPPANPVNPAFGNAAQHLQIAPGSPGGIKRWLPPGSTVEVLPCPAGYARQHFDDGAAWPVSPGPDWVKDTSADLGSCRKA